LGKGILVAAVCSVRSRELIGYDAKTKRAGESVGNNVRVLRKERGKEGYQLDRRSEFDVDRAVTQSCHPVSGARVSK
jgi:hypothetical protein